MEKPLVPPNWLIAVDVGVAVVNVIRVLMFQAVTRFAPVVAPEVPTPTNKRSLVPSKYSNNGEQVLAGLATVVMFRLSDMAGVIFIILVAAKDRKSTRLNSSHVEISYAVFC